MFPANRGLNRSRSVGIGRGEADDDEASAQRLLGRLVQYWVFADAAGKMNLRLVQVKGALLLVPQLAWLRIPPRA